MAKRFDFSIKRGEELQKLVAIKLIDSDGVASYVDFSGYTFVGFAKRPRIDSVIMLSLDVAERPLFDGEDESTVRDNQAFSVGISSDDTAGMSVGSYNYDIIGTGTDGKTRSLLTGYITVEENYAL